MLTTSSANECNAHVQDLKRSEDLLYSRVMRRILPLLVICYAVSFLDRVNISFAKLQMASDLRFSDTVYGIGAGIFFIGYVLSEVPSNLLLHRYGARQNPASAIPGRRRRQ
jgi:sugar phosphate permease